jgi:hypothetical protein
LEKEQRLKEKDFEEESGRFFFFFGKIRKYLRKREKKKTSKSNRDGCRELKRKRLQGCAADVFEKRYQEQRQKKRREKKKEDDVGRSLEL